jgi:hypothetical protein
MDYKGHYQKFVVKEFVDSTDLAAIPLRSIQSIRKELLSRIN